MKVNRRLLLGGAIAALAGGTLLARRRPERADAVIVGAGLAGLNAARQLEGAGAKVIVLEAAQRVGGRVNTLYAAPGAPELGAADVGALYARVLDTANTLGLGLTPWPADLPEYWFHLHGRAFTAGDWPTLDVNPLAGSLRSLPPPALAFQFMPRPNPLPDLGAWLKDEYQALDLPLGQFLRANGAPDAAMPYITIGTQFDSLDDTSALWQLRGGKFASLAFETAQASNSPLRYFINGGTSRLSDAMAAALNSPVRLGHGVVAIENSADGVTVECGDGRRFRAPTAICAVPLPVLRKIAISPALPGLAAEAVEQIPYGAATSVVLHVKERFWEIDGMPPNIWSDLPIQRAFLNPSPTGEGEHLWVFTTGPADLARRDLPDEELGRFVLAELNRVRPSTVGRLEVAGVRSFTRDPLTLGTYASRAPGQIKRFGNVLAQPVGRLHFAGEHTAELNSGMEAAMESGERAALAVLSST